MDTKISKKTACATPRFDCIDHCPDCNFQCNQKILVFAGTFEGHELAKYFDQRGWNRCADFCVATEYGTETFSDIKGLSIIEGRLNEAAMEELLKSGPYGLVVDATHPYAKAVTENLQKACQISHVEYVRLLRREGFFDYEGVNTVESAEEAVAYLLETEGKILLTTGSKELSKYRRLSDRIVARVLPSQDSLRLCFDAGIPAKNIICMQGPFTKEMNLATMEQYGCKWLVTKKTGQPGGFDDKVRLCEEGYRIIVIGRPQAETGLSLEEVKERVEAFYGE